MGDAMELKADSSREAQMEVDEALGPIYLLWKTPIRLGARMALLRQCA
jgi:hypothetical protein